MSQFPNYMRNGTDVYNSAWVWSPRASFNVIQRSFWLILVLSYTTGAVVAVIVWYNYLCNKCLSPLMLWIRISIRTKCTTLCDKICQWLATDRWFCPGPPVSFTNITDLHDIAEIWLKVALNTIKQTNMFHYN